MNYRNQWPAIDANFTTISAYADFYIEDKNSGVGALLTRDYVGSVGLQSISFALQYAYQLQITKTLSFRPVYEVAGLLGLSGRALHEHLNDRLPAWRRRAGSAPGRWPDRYSGAAAVDWDAD
jgi:hypothetical protein